MSSPITQAQVESRYQQYHAKINEALAACFPKASPATLYDPARYILEGKGKRIRPFLTLLASEAVSGSSDNALGVALGIEVLHNFTLMHDDIMDAADLRHGRPTVHKQWDVNAAILAGDMMIACAYELALKAISSRHAEMAHIFNDANITICEGQALDMELEQRKDVTIADYLDMIAKKTGRLISAALEAGGVAGNGTPAEIAALATFGEKIGRAFQIQDDYLDIMADDGKSGKVPGGDVINGKKTWPKVLTANCCSRSSTTTEPRRKTSRQSRRFSRSAAYSTRHGQRSTRIPKQPSTRLKACPSRKVAAI